LATKQRTEGEV